MTILRRALGLLLACSLLAACSDGGEPRRVATADEQTTTTTTEVSGAESGGGTTTTAAVTTTTAAGTRTTVTTARKVAGTPQQATAATVASTTTTTAGATTTAPTTSTTAAGPTTTTTKPLQSVPALLIPQQTCSSQLEAAFPIAVDQAKLRADLEAQGYAMPSPSMFRNRDSVAIENPSERNLDGAQKKIDECAAAQGGPATGTVKLASGSSGSQLLGQLVKDQMTAAQFKNYKGTTVTGP